MINSSLLHLYPYGYGKTPKTVIVDGIVIGYVTDRGQIGALLWSNGQGKIAESIQSNSIGSSYGVTYSFSEGPASFVIESPFVPTISQWQEFAN